MLRTISGHLKDKLSIDWKNCNDRNIRWPMNTAQMGKYLLETRSFLGPIHKLKDTAMYVKKKNTKVNLAIDCHNGGHHTIIIIIYFFYFSKICISVSTAV